MNVPSSTHHRRDASTALGGRSGPASSAQRDNNRRVGVNSVASRCHRREAAAAAALPGRAQQLGSLDRDTFSHDVAVYLEEEGAGRVVEVQGEGTAVRSAVMT
jgi:hypothetical protein